MFQSHKNAREGLPLMEKINADWKKQVRFLGSTYNHFGHLS
jgi:hypothetical protein